MEQKYAVKNGIEPFATGASKMVFPIRFVNNELKDKLESYNDGLFIKRIHALNNWKYKNQTLIIQKLAELTDIDKKIAYTNAIDAIANKMDGTEQCFFPVDNDISSKLVVLQIPVKSENSLQYLYKEIQLQTKLNKQNMMPKIYQIQLLVKFDQTTYSYFTDTIEKFLEHDSFASYINNPETSIVCIFLLEEMCDRYEPADITIKQTKNYVNQVAKLAKATAELGYYNTDFKHGNECPTTDEEDGELHLIKLRALDMDPKMLIQIDDELKDAAAIFMFMIYLLHFSVKRNFYFLNRENILESILEHGRIELKSMGISNSLQCIQVIEKLKKANIKIILASYLTATGDEHSIINDRQNVPTLLTQHLLNLIRPVSDMVNISGLKRKPE